MQKIIFHFKIFGVILPYKILLLLEETMMKKLLLGMLLIFLYCFPYVYFSMYLDYSNGSMLGFGLMIIITSILAFCGVKYVHYIHVIIGNSLSMIISFYFIGEMSGVEEWGGYFKPITPNQLLIVVTILNLIPQYFAARLAKKYKKK